MNEPKKPTRNIFKWLRKKKEPEVSGQKYPTTSESILQPRKIENLQEINDESKSKPTFCHKLSKHNDDKINIHGTAVLQNASETDEHFENCEDSFLENNGFSTLPSKNKKKNHDGLSYRAKSLQSIPLTRDGEIKQEKKSGVSKVLGRLASSLGSLSRFGKSKKTKLSIEDLTGSAEFVHEEKTHKWTVHIPHRKAYNVSSSEKLKPESIKSCRVNNLFVKEALGSPLASSTPSFSVVMERTNIQLSQFNFPSPQVKSTNKPNLVFHSTPPESCKLPSKKYAKHFNDFVCEEKSSEKHIIAHDPDRTGAESKMLSGNEKDGVLSVVSSDFSADNTLFQIKGVSLETLKNNTAIMTSYNCDNSEGDSDEYDDEVFLSGLTNKKGLFGNSNPRIPSVIEPLCDSVSAANVSETDLNILSDTSSSSYSSDYSDMSISMHHLTISSFLHHHHSLSITSDITDVTSMASSSSTTPSTTHRESDSNLDISAINILSPEDGTAQDHQHSTCEHNDHKHDDCHSEKSKNTSFLCPKVSVVKQPSFGELERDFNDFVKDYKLKQTDKQK